MTKIDDGGPAYPILNQHAFTGDIIGSKGGMSKREVFAGMAMQGMLAGEVHYETTELAEFSVVCADALIAALKEESDGL